jgi:hypothetical protein
MRSPVIQEFDARFAAPLFHVQEHQPEMFNRGRVMVKNGRLKLAKRIRVLLNDRIEKYLKPVAVVAIHSTPPYPGTATLALCRSDYETRNLEAGKPQ